VVELKDYKFKDKSLQVQSLDLVQDWFLDRFKDNELKVKSLENPRESLSSKGVSGLQFIRGSLN
jgi:aminoglycoside/choline kinase family phosphotransferase